MTARSAGGAIFGRQAFVGLSKNGIGSLTFGRQYSFSTDYIGANYSMGSQTPAGNYAYHINDLDQLTSSRINNAVKFQSANFAGLTFGAMYGFSNSTQFAGTPTTTGANGSQGSSSAYSFGANYAQGPFGIGAAYTNIRFPNGAQPAFGVSIANLNTQGCATSRRSASARAMRSRRPSCGRTGPTRSSCRCRARRRS